MRIDLALHRRMSPLLLAAALGAGGCVATPDDTAQACEGKCDGTREPPQTASCQRLEIQGLVTPVYPSVNDPNKFYYVPNHFTVSDIRSFLPPELPTDHGLTEEELRRSPYLSQLETRFVLTLDPAVEPDGVRDTIRQADIAPGPIVLEPLRVTGSDHDDALVTNITRDIDETVASGSRYLDGLRYEVTVFADTPGVHVTTLGFFRKRAGIVTAALPVSFPCLGEVEDQFDHQEALAFNNELTYAGEGMILSNGPDAVETMTRVLDNWSYLRGVQAAFGEADRFDSAGPARATREVVVGVLGYGTPEVDVAAVADAGERAVEILGATYRAAATSYGKTVDDVDAHLSAVAAGGPALTELDQYFVTLHASTRSLRAFTAGTRIEPFAD